MSPQYKQKLTAVLKLLIMAVALRNMLVEMESAFISIFFEAASQVAQVAQSKIFVVLESSDGLRLVGLAND